MKTFATLSIALLFSAGSAFAQSNDSTVDQIGNDNDATTTQTGSDNVAAVQQGGFGGGLVQSNNAEAIIDQAGSMNEAYINQRQGWAGGTAVSLHTIDQDGSDNDALLTTFNGGNSGEIVQSGDENYARGRQSGSGSVLGITQTGFSNWADVDQLNAPGGDVSVTQIGDDNSATVGQKGADNTVLIEQGVYGGSTLSSVVFDQDGEGNYLEAKMVRSTSNEVTGSQTGDDNFYRVGVRGESNTVSMDMEGNSNRGSWGISSAWPESADGNTLSIDVTGDLIYSTGSIDGDNNTVTLTQEGLGNMIGSDWYTTDGVTIAGDGNTVTIGQSSDFNTASAVVTGNSNTATITQD